jgi:uncharacterized YigZ family protein
MKTLAGPCRYEETIRKSRFIAHAAPVKTQADTLDFYESVIDPGASHNCWAWSIDHVHRSNDDGEPSGSAGRPILAMIEGRGLEQVMIVVTRYFGGIKLGIGGLVRAYGGTAAKCLDRAKIIDWQPKVECELQFEFPLAAAVHGLLEQFGVKKHSEAFDSAGARLLISIEERQFAALKSALADTSRGQAQLRKTASTG